jgi:hypothetical protein
MTEKAVHLVTISCQVEFADFFECLHLKVMTVRTLIAFATASSLKKLTALTLEILAS